MRKLRKKALKKLVKILFERERGINLLFDLVIKLFSSTDNKSEAKTYATLLFELGVDHYIEYNDENNHSFNLYSRRDVYLGKIKYYKPNLKIEKILKGAGIRNFY